jgi:hypothetical protein
MAEESKKADGWGEWAHRVLGDIERIETKLDKAMSQINQLGIDIAVLKTKAATIGAAWGLVASIIASVVIHVLIKSK